MSEATPELSEFDKSRLELMYECLNVIGIPATPANIYTINISKTEIETTENMSALRELIPRLKEYYSSDMLTCLHSNSAQKQKFPIANALRQILKCNYFNLEPHVLSDGYDKATGKKRTIRIYLIRNRE